MTTSIDSAAVRAALEKTGSARLLSSWGEDADKHLRKIAAELKGFVHEFRRRFKETPDVLGLVAVNPAKAAAFFQLDTLTASREMKIMVWRLLLGGEIEELEFRYKAGKRSSFRVQLVSLEGRKETYQSTDASDFRVLRHVGLAGSAGEDKLQGYYAFQGSN